MKSNRKGFTLIELLAIIVILAIIAVITVPIILNIIESAKKGAAKDSAYGYKDAVQKTYLNNAINGDFGSGLNGNYTIGTDGNLNNLEGSLAYNVDVSGTIPSGGYLNISNNIITEGCIQIDEYAVDIENNKVKEPIKGVCGASRFNSLATVYKSNVDDNGSSLPDGSYIINSDGRLRDLTGAVVLPAIDSNPNGGYLVISDGTVSSGCMQFSSVIVNISNGNLHEPISGTCENIQIPAPVVHNCSDSDYIPDDESWFTTMNVGGDLFITGYSENHPIDNTDLKLPCTIGGIPVKGIFYTAFGHKGLTSVVIPNGIKYIYNAAFSGNNLMTLAVPGTIEDIPSPAFSENEIRKLTLGNGIKTIGGVAFVNNKIEEINIPSTVTSIGHGAFNNNLVEGNAAFIYDLNNSTKLVSYAGKNKDVIVPSNVVTIGDYAFNSCHLTSVSIPEGVVTIGQDAFVGNDLTNVVIPNSVVTIGQGAFNKNNLYEVTIGTGAIPTNSPHEIFFKGPNSNSNLTIIHNLSGQAFKWDSMINAPASSGNPAYTFVTGVVPNALGDVTILGE